MTKTQRFLTVYSAVLTLALAVLVDHRAGAQEETAVDGAAGDLDEAAAFGDKA